MKRIAVIGAMVAWAAASHAGLLSWSGTAPSVDGLDVANFSGVTNDAANIAAGDDAATYVAANRSPQGQTFTMGGTAGLLQAVTVQDVNYATWSSIDTGWTGYNGGRFLLQIGTISGTNFTVIASEEAYMDASAPANAAGTAGSAYFATIALDTPVALAADTEYAFALTTTADFNPWDGPYFELNGDGTTSANYADGEAFTLGGTPGGEDINGNVTALTGDRVFHADVVIPEPATVGLVGIFGTGILFMRRRFMK